jgi:hypothetical protein
MLMKGSGMGSFTRYSDDPARASFSGNESPSWSRRRHPVALFLQGPRPRPMILPLFNGPVPSKFGMEISYPGHYRIITHMSIKI